MRNIYKISKWLHKYIGLLLVLFLMWMSLSGVLLNHPELIADLTVPQFLTPKQYKVKNWNRSSLTELQFLESDSNIAIGCGKLGVWKTTDGGFSFVSMSDGLPAEALYRKTRDIFVWEGDSTLIFAGTHHGLYVCNFENEKWRNLKLDGLNPEIKKIVSAKNELLVFTESEAYKASFPARELQFQKVKLKRDKEAENTVSLIRLFFHLHSGEIWGLPGKLLFDIVGIILFFLSISAFYSWYYPWKRKRDKKGVIVNVPIVKKAFKWFFKYHLKLGIWSAVILFIMGVTGFFMRPPMLAVIAEGSIPISWYPGTISDNPWDEKIKNALYDSDKDQLIVEATDGFWVGAADLNSTFENKEMNVPVFVMGTTVFEPIDSTGILTGSFNGLFRWDKETDKSVDLIEGKDPKTISSIKPAELMVTGFFSTPQLEKFITTHEQGLLPLNQAEGDGRFKMSATIRENYSMPLWNWLFEIHNGRFFKDTIGAFYILLVPLGSFFFVLITLSGVIDWIYIKIGRNPIMKKLQKNK
ncbi:MAG: PepSY domain-containing protein [Calditrichaeota bacterium]|nr:MAG: PepSY domain-containing protein [Calditrichota bacterium]MBL1204572.1 PepSY domain-containing protein [Calditrichota bacterium]NOG44401.1 PepSY domain-containing protein [Calditrichota bacterium]